MHQKGEKEAELNALSKMKIETIWLNELTKLNDEYNKGTPLKPRHDISKKTPLKPEQNKKKKNLIIK